ncbi:MAG: hypothetical protein NC117_05385 [Pseudoflavonifractor sp.]|nr:hypothetical protein [Pseudoflavonifractor sp.]
MTNKDIDDERLRLLLKSELPQAEENRWFTNRVLNRLPPKSRVASRVVTALSVIAAVVVLVVCLLDSCRSVADSGVVTVDNLILFSALGLATVSLVVAPLWSRLVRAV